MTELIGFIILIQKTSLKYIFIEKKIELIEILIKKK